LFGAVRRAIVATSYPIEGFEDPRSYPGNHLECFRK
jgi:hypothetical protein